MLINFTLSNFRSYKDEATLTFVSNSKIRKLKTHEIKVNKLSVLKNCALYGPNAAGKSNMINALSFAKGIVLYANITSDFSFKGLENEPSTFSFVISNKNNCIYEYSFSIRKQRNLFHGYEVLYEYLGIINEKSERIFEYKDESFKLCEKLKKSNSFNTYIDGYKNISNQLFLSFLSMDDKIIDEEIKNHILNVFNFFKNDLIIISNEKNFNMINTNNIGMISSFLKKYDTGIDRLEFVPCLQEEVGKFAPFELINSYIIEAQRHNMKRFSLFNNKELFQFELQKDKIDIKKMISKHNNIEKSFNFEDESEGTKRMMFLISVLFANESDEKVYVIDEIERSMHPLLCTKLIDEFQRINSELRNQLLFTTHYVGLMDDCLRRDELYFCEKDNEGTSKLISLQEYKSRTDTIISKKYLEGRFGGVPNLKVENKWFH
ncbi:MAG: ATP-binding protein [Erysipelotrichaceae bacterium]|nr:ATP-binding protein [Erysipelotrichaceae bacterium]